MQYKRYGNEGPNISRLGFGAMRLPTKKEGATNKVDFDKSSEIEITSSGTVHLQVDGEYSGTLPAKIDVVKDAMSLVW